MSSTGKEWIWRWSSGGSLKNLWKPSQWKCERALGCMSCMIGARCRLYSDCTIWLSVEKTALEPDFIDRNGLSFVNNLNFALAFVVQYRWPQCCTSTCWGCTWLRRPNAARKLGMPL
jgi:hypothetical protein